MNTQRIAAIIDSSPMNRGMIGEAWLDNPANTAIVTGENVMLFERQSKKFCEFHWLQTANKGRQAIENTREAMRSYFAANPEVNFIYGLIPVEHRASLLMARWIGATPAISVELEHGKVQLFTITREHLEG